MRVAFFQFFPPTIWTPGGGETQLAKTKEAMEQMGVEIELFDPWSRKRDYDIMHVFGSTYQLSDFVVTAKRLGLPVVVSPIIYTNKPGWKWRVWRQVDHFLPVPTVYTYRKRIYEVADVLLPGSEAEANQLAQNFAVPLSKMVVTHNAADGRLAEADPKPFKDHYGLEGVILMVGRISNHKGQIRLIHALDGQGLELVFIGQMDPDDPGYFAMFQAECERRSWVHYLGPLPAGSDLLASAYAAAKVHALPSLGECPGLVSLEAGLAGCNVVAGCGAPVREHLGEEAFYCDPTSIGSIRATVLKAYASPRTGKLRARLLKDFTWEAVARKIHAVYEEVLGCGQ